MRCDPESMCNAGATFVFQVAGSLPWLVRLTDVGSLGLGRYPKGLLQSGGSGQGLESSFHIWPLREFKDPSGREDS
jgi:hypothetical protein